MMDIEYKILRHPMSRPRHFAMNLTSQFSKQESYSELVLTQPEPLINFILFNGTNSSPPVHVYTISDMNETMTTVGTEFLSKEVGIVGFEDNYPKKTIKLPRILDWYMKDFAPTEKEMLKAITPYLSHEITEKIKSFEASSLRIKYKDYKWSLYEGFVGSLSYDPNKFVEETKKLNLEREDSQLIKKKNSLIQ